MGGRGKFCTKGNQMAKTITPRGEDFSRWYNDIVLQAKLADYSSVRGCMVIRPYGYAIWERMQAALDGMFKDTGHQNAYFPLLIPKSYLSREAEHVKGFAKECAVVTHYRLKTSPDGQGVVVDPEAKLEEELIVRPTSETIIWNTYKDWIQSYRDLPLLINQWANVMRWEMRTRLFLRTAEFLWQEGHTAHATSEEARAEALRMVRVYETFLQDWLAVPVVVGVKSATERFAGAVDTYCVEALMQDGKALQAGTSHFLGQNFAKAFDVKFLDQQGQQQYVWATSWGSSTRLMGAFIMVHSDDHGLVVPPKVAPVHVVGVPIYKTAEERSQVVEALSRLMGDLRAQGLVCELDDDDTQRPGFKFAEQELRGVPVRLAMGPRDLAQGRVEVMRRDTLEKASWPIGTLAAQVPELLEQIQQNLFARAKAYRDEHITEANSYEEFKEILETKGGFVSAHWDGTAETEALIKEETKATIRCIPLSQSAEPGSCIRTGKPSKQRVLFARAY